MSLKYGLNIKKAAPAAPARKTILDDEDEEDVDPQNDDGVEEISSFGSNAKSKPSQLSNSGPPPPRRKPQDQQSKQDLSASATSKTHIKAAEELDPSIFDYDSFHTAKESVAEAKKEAARQDAVDRKPKYIDNLLDAAARRKQDQLVAREKFLQKEREAEGDEFADKEKFVTGAYKEQQAEARKLEEEEAKKKEEEEERRRKMGGGMQGFYKGMMDQREQQHQEALEAAEKMEKESGGTATEAGEQKAGGSDADLIAEMKAKGKNIHLNEEGQVTDKRELLSAGLNISKPSESGKGGADHLRTSARPAQSAFQQKNNVNRDAQRERQTRMMEEQLAAQNKRAREEEEEERLKAERAAKSTKTEGEVGDAKARYLARKAARERGES